MAKAKTFEEQLSELETVIGELERGELALEEMLRRYADGVKLVAACRDKLTAAENKLNNGGEAER